MKNKEDKGTFVPGWLRATAMLIAMLVGLTALGVVMPWSAASKEEVTRKFEQNDREHTDIQKSLSRMDGKLDIILQELKRE